MSGKLEKIRRSYRLFTKLEKTSEKVNINDIAKATGWAKSTVKTYITKKWDKFLKKASSTEYVVEGVSTFNEEEYIRMMSQKDSISNEPLKPDLPIEVERLIVKAREAAILALDIYNRPATIFRTEGFSVMMVIAWTALFHAIFESRNLKYFYHEANGRITKIDGDKKAWELSKCVSVYYGNSNNPIRANLEFFVGLRNKIEHRYVPALDPHVAGECQSLLLNFDELLVDKFGDYYALREYLTVPLQTTNLRAESQVAAMRKFQGKQYDELKDYIDSFRANLSDSIYEDPKFSFRVFLVPKVGNHATSSDIAFEFVKYDPENVEEIEALSKQITLIREKGIPVANQGKYKPKVVSQIVSEKLGRPFSVPHHTNAWKYYKIRKSGEMPEECKTDYCQFDIAHRDYIYTDKWIEFLVRKLSDEAEYIKITSYRW